MHGKDYIKAAQAIDFRHNKYTKLVTSVVKHIVEASLINSELSKRREAAEKAKKQKEDHKEGYRMLSYPSQLSARQVTPKASLSNYQSFTNAKPKHKQVEKYLSNLWIKDIGQDTRPITWLELYMTYRLRGYHQPLSVDANAARTKPTLDKQLKEFKKMVKAVIDKDFGGQGEAKIFKPAKQQADLLRGVGILGKHACLSFNIVVTESEQSAMAKALIRVNRTISDKHIVEYMQGARKLAPHDIKMNGKTGWDSSLPIVNDESTYSNRWEPFAIGKEPPRKTIVFYVCPNAVCSKREPSSAKGFQPYDFDKLQKCQHCRKTTAARKWLCECKVPWFTCEAHRSYHCYDKVCLQKNHKEEPSVANTCLRSKMLKRRRINMEHEEIVAQEGKRAKLMKLREAEGCRKKDIELEDAPHPKVPRILGPILQQRFRGTSSASLSASSNNV